MHAVILSCPNCPPIHVGHLQKHNPYLPVSIYYEEQWGEKEINWRNADRMIRNWWKRNRDCFSTEKQFIILEWDVFINDQLEWVDLGEDLSGKNLHTNPKAAWKWMREQDRLPMKPVGLSPLACITMSRKALDEIVKKKYDDLFDQDIFCELRLPSIVANAGLVVKPMPLPCVNSKTINPSGFGIFHAVKHPQPFLKL